MHATANCKRQTCTNAHNKQQHPHFNFQRNDARKITKPGPNRNEAHLCTSLSGIAQIEQRLYRLAQRTHWSHKSHKMPRMYSLARRPHIHCSPHQRAPCCSRILPALHSILCARWAQHEPRPSRCKLYPHVGAQFILQAGERSIHHPTVAVWGEQSCEYVSMYVCMYVRWHEYLNFLSTSSSWLQTRVCECVTRSTMG